MCVCHRGPQAQTDSDRVPESAGAFTGVYSSVHAVPCAPRKASQPQLNSPTSLSCLEVQR